MKRPDIQRLGTIDFNVVEVTLSKHLLWGLSYLPLKQAILQIDQGVTRMAKIVWMLTLVLVLLCNSGCSAIAGAAIALPFEAAVTAQKLSFAQVQGTIKVVQGGVSVVESVGKVIHNQRMRHLELAKAQAE
jgi:hypothetical protein